MSSFSLQKLSKNSLRFGNLRALVHYCCFKPEWSGRNKAPWKYVTLNLCGKGENGYSTEMVQTTAGDLGEEGS